MPDINLTICLSFDSTVDRAIIQATDQKYRALKRPSIAQSLVNLLLLARQIQAAKINDRAAVGHVELNGEVFTITIAPPGYSDPSSRF